MHGVVREVPKTKSSRMCARNKRRTVLSNTIGNISRPLTITHGNVTHQNSKCPILNMYFYILGRFKA